MKSPVLFKSLDHTNVQYDWIEIELDSFMYMEGNSGSKGHTNSYNLSVFVTSKELQRIKNRVKEINGMLYGIAN